MPDKTELIEQIKADFPRTWKTYRGSDDYDPDNLYNARYFFDRINIFISTKNYPTFKVRGYCFEFKGYRWRYEIYYHDTEYKIDSGFKSRGDAELEAIKKAFEIAELDFVWVPPAREKSYEEKTQYAEYVLGGKNITFK